MTSPEAQSMTRVLGAATPGSSDVDDLDLLDAVEAGLFGATPTPLEIGRYRLVRLLGRGGFGRVYEADDPELDRRVAIKLIALSSLGGDGGTDELRREARALARVEHRHCVAVFDVGTYELEGEAHARAQAIGVPTLGVYIVMALVRGRPLTQWLVAAPTGSRIIEVFEQLADALAAAHRVGVVHGDFKPGNVVIDDDRRAQVLDFGLARLREPGLDDDDAAGDRIAGTPRYMAPEQRRGAPATPRSDQYAWAASLHEALCGTIPRASDTLDAPIRAEFTTPTQGGHRPLPRWLEPVLRRAMAVEPHLRHDSMDALLVALRRGRGRRRALLLGTAAAITAGAIASVAVLASRTPTCEPTAAIDALWNDAGRSRLEAAFVASGRAHAPVSWTNASHDLDAWVERHRDRAREACAAPSANATATLACLEQQASQFAGVLGVLGSGAPENVDDAHVLAGSLPDPAQCTGASAVVDHATVLQYERVAAAEALLALGRTSAARVAIAELLTSPELAPAPHAKALLLGARAAMAEGEEPAATPALEEVFALATEHRLDHTETVALSCLGAAAGMRGDSGSTRSHMQLARARLAATAPPPDVEVDARRCLAHAAASVDEHQVFVDDWTRIHELQRDRFGDEHPLALAALEEVAFGRYRIRDETRARELVDDLPARLAARLGEDHPATLDAEMLRVLVKAELGLTIDSSAELAALVERHVRVLGPDHVMTSTAHHNAAIIAQREGREDDALPHARRAVEIRERALGIDASRTLESATLLALLTSHEGERRAAVSRLDRHLPPARRRLGDRNGAVLRARGLRMQLVAVSRRDGAALLDEARELLEASRQGGRDPQAGALARSLLARLLRRSGRSVEALALDEASRLIDCNRTAATARRCALSSASVAISSVAVQGPAALPHAHAAIEAYLRTPGATASHRENLHYQVAELLELRGDEAEAVSEYLLSEPRPPERPHGLADAYAAFAIARLSTLPFDERRRRAETAQALFAADGSSAEAAEVAAWLTRFANR
ncbi:MAG: serine/threonine protein kinase [Deltaproteobacteria bacterium]|nr:serine/threonine protein kinase [Deltaproteobacteria bacterium]MBK8715648.1 serine/threonine protein kinase [Deltaproteobacteria bacterium]MBP7287250.1 serine/threonine protein kinase [Nannocystaceae bacterium]